MAGRIKKLAVPLFALLCVAGIGAIATPARAENSQAPASPQAQPTAKALAQAMKINKQYERAAARRPKRDNYAFVAKRLGKTKDDVIEAVSIVAEYRARLEEKMADISQRVGRGIRIDVKTVSATKYGPHTAMVVVGVVGCPDSEHARIGVQNLLNDSLGRLAVEMPEGITSYHAQIKFSTGSCGAGKLGPVFVWTKKNNKVKQL